ncbi:unnamed protein product [Orchesella dallaii]|uniref:Uncharacterized protein n=1 Tax=Orchesella dallaii TaxID=48710 RepID=A0ABP1PWI3_9HEXA
MPGIMEGYNPTLGCSFGCPKTGRSWVPYPRSVYPRRDPLVDAVGRTDNPCDRPARCGPCCDPLPKYRRPRELPECNICCYQDEQQEAKRQEACEEYQDFVKNCCPPYCPDQIIEALDPNHPIAVQLPDQTPIEDRCIMMELPCRTNIIAGFFNPDDNKTVDEKMRERCDRTYLSCGPNLPLYPCRGVIDYPKIAWSTVGEEMNKCCNPICEDSKYCDPAFQQEQMALRRQREMAQRMEAQRQRMEEEARNRFFNPNQPHPCCANEKFSQGPYCNGGYEMN